MAEVASNLGQWKHATTRSTAADARALPTKAAAEMLRDPKWVAKLKRAIDQSEAGDTIAWEDYIKNPG
jgi:hypothetical protein